MTQIANIINGQGALSTRALAALPAIRPFLSSLQLATLVEHFRSEEKNYFFETVISLAALIETMPKTYEQDGLGDTAIVSLHYFLGNSHFYITEKDREGGVDQAFGFVVLNGDTQNAELGYISIAEIVRHRAELDLHFSPCTLAEIKAQYED
jgi:hypothetical protein